MSLCITQSRKEKECRTLSRSISACRITSMHFWRSSSEMTNGGENRMLFKENGTKFLSWLAYSGNRSCTHTYMFTWVGLASTPRLLSSKQNCHAVRARELALSSSTMALNSPRPRTSLTRGERSARISFRHRPPSRVARSARPSSIRTSSAVIATAQPSGFLFKFACRGEDEKWSENMKERRRTRHRYYHVRLAGYT